MKAEQAYKEREQERTEREMREKGSKRRRVRGKRWREKVRERVGETDIKRESAMQISINNSAG